MPNVPGPSEREHQRYRRIIGAAGIHPDQDLSPEGIAALAWLTRRDDDAFFEGVVELLGVVRQVAYAQGHHPTAAGGTVLARVFGPDAQHGQTR